MSKRIAWFTFTLIFAGAAQAGWFSEKVDLGKPIKFVSQQPEFTASPPLKLQQASSYLGTVSQFSQTKPPVFVEKLGQPSAPAGSQSRTPQVISRTYTLGGLFLLGRVLSNPGSLFTSKTRLEGVKEISRIDGALFPLHTGNKLSFFYSMFNKSDVFHVEYEVGDQMPGSKFAKQYRQAKSFDLVGDVYTVTSETRSDKGMDEVCEYYYADELAYPLASRCGNGPMMWLASYQLNGQGKTYLSELIAASLQQKQQDILQKQEASCSLSPALKEKARERFSQGFELFQDGEFDAAVIRFKGGLELDPANARGNYYLAETYVRMHDVENAKKYYRYTVEFAPEIKEAALAQARLEKLK